MGTKLGFDEMEKLWRRMVGRLHNNVGILNATALCTLDIVTAVHFVLCIFLSHFKIFYVL